MRVEYNEVINDPIVTTNAIREGDTMLILSWRNEDVATFVMSDNRGELGQGILVITRFPDGTSSHELRAHTMPVKAPSRHQKALHMLGQFSKQIKENDHNFGLDFDAKPN